MNNIYKNIIEKCSGCGLCESVCPVNAIAVKENNSFLRPEVNDNCINCGKCLASCPGHIEYNPVSYKEFHYRMYGHSNNPNVRKEAASGALTTELLKYLLDHSIVDYVITADVYQNNRDLGYIIVDKSNSNRLFAVSGSNYCPTNIGKAIRWIKKNDGKYAVVCLPCLARGINKLKERDAIVDKRIKYVITLMCNHVPSYEATDYLLKKYKIEHPKKIKYRGDGWFGNFRAFRDYESNSPFFSVPFSKYFESKFSKYFWQNACMNCRDHFGSAADVCMGDADFIKYRNKFANQGETMVFSNNSQLVYLLNDMHEKKIISTYNDINECELEEIYGPLCDENRAKKDCVKSGADKILKEERRELIINRLKYILFQMKHFLLIGTSNEK